MILPVSLTAAGAAALMNIWLATRVSRVRRARKISVGDGGDETLSRRMRAQANYVENAPFFLVLLVLLELAGAWSLALWGAVILFFLARIAHAFGMDRSGAPPPRLIGVGVTWLVLLGLALWAIVLTYQGIERPAAGQPASSSFKV